MNDTTLILGLLLSCTSWIIIYYSTAHKTEKLGWALNILSILLIILSTL